LPRIGALNAKKTKCTFSGQRKYILAYSIFTSFNTTAEHLTDLVNLNLVILV